MLVLDGTSQSLDGALTAKPKSKVSTVPVQVRSATSVDETIFVTSNMTGLKMLTGGVCTAEAYLRLRAIWHYDVRSTSSRDPSYEVFF